MAYLAKEALDQFFNTYATLAGEAELPAYREEVEKAFAEEDVAVAFSKFDNLQEKFSSFSLLHDYVFDLLLQYWYEVHGEDDGFFETDTWKEVEEKSLDIGSEFFSILFYLQECHNEKIAPQAEDFIFDFISYEDEMEQDQFVIYEPLIRNIALTDEAIQNSKHAAAQLKGHEMQDLFLPLMLLFNNETETAEKLSWIKANGTPTEAAIYAAMAAFL